MEGSQALHARIIIFSDGFVTNSSNTQGSDSVSEETSKQVVTETLTIFFYNLLVKYRDKQNVLLLK